MEPLQHYKKHEYSAAIVPALNTHTHTHTQTQTHTHTHHTNIEPLQHGTAPANKASVKRSEECKEADENSQKSVPIISTLHKVNLY